MPEETTIEQKLALVEAKLDLVSYDRLKVLDERLAKVESNISLILKIVLIAVPVFGGAWGTLSYFLYGISERIGRLDARVDGYQNEALLKTLNEIKTGGANSSAAREIVQTFEKIVSDTARREQQKLPVSGSIYYELGLFAASNGNMRQAADYLEQAVAASPPDYRAWSFLSAAYIDIADAEPQNKLHYAQKAEQAARKALEISGNDWRAHQNIGIAVFMQGNKQAAADELKKAVAADPKATAPLYNLACMYAEGSWDTSKALQYLELAVDKGYSNLHRLTGDEKKCFKSISQSKRFLVAKNIVITRAKRPVLP